MKKVLYLAGLAILGFLIYTFFGQETHKINPNFKQTIQTQRAEKDQFFKTSNDSPIADKTTFKSLNYFLPNEKYVVEATIIPYENTDNEAIITMSNGGTEKYQKFGYAEFQLDNQTHKLLIYKHESGLSILFKDATAPKETYGGGRYLDFEESQIQGNKLMIDFNTAYNPYCAYNHEYSCPIPPAENILKVRVEAGEKLFTDNK